MSRTPAPVLVVGDCLLDVHVVASGPIQPGADIPARIELAPGGQGGNVAVRLARAGVAARLLAPLATDAIGTGLREVLEAEGVELIAIPAGVAGVVVVLREARGERSMLSHRAPFPATALDAVSRDVAGSQWVVISGYALLDPIGEALARRVAARHGARLAVLGCAFGSAAVRFGELLRVANPDLLILNRDEALALGLVPAEWRLGDVAEGASSVRSAIPGVTVVTEAGGAAAILGDGDSVLARVRTPQGSVVDATGAGDAAAAGMIAGLLDHGWPPSGDALRRALGAGVALGAAVAGVAGAQGRVPGERAVAPDGRGSAAHRARRR